MPGSRRKAMPYAVAMLTVIGFAPLALNLASAAIANALGCRLDESGVHPCPVFGMDIGASLYAGAMMIWIFVLTAPIALLGLILLIVLTTRILMRMKKIGRDDADQSANPGLFAFSRILSAIRKRWPSGRYGRRPPDRR